MKGIARALHIFEYVANHGPIGVSDLARRIDLPKSTVQRHLHALADADWLRAVGDHDTTKWTVTARALILSHRGSQEGAVASVARNYMIRLRDQVDETVTLQVLKSNYETVAIERIDSFQPVRTFSSLGAVSYISSTSGGLAVLAIMPDDWVNEALSKPIPAMTPDTMTNPDEIRAYLKQVRADGYSVSRGQNRPGVRAVGAAITDASHTPVAALSISFPENRFDEKKIPEWGELVRSTAKAISNEL